MGRANRHYRGKNVSQKNNVYNACGSYVFYGAERAGLRKR